jgi:hypothetical protein
MGTEAGPCLANEILNSVDRGSVMLNPSLVELEALSCCYHILARCIALIEICVAR